MSNSHQTQVFTNGLWAADDRLQILEADITAALDSTRASWPDDGLHINVPQYRGQLQGYTEPVDYDPTGDGGARDFPSYGQQSHHLLRFGVALLQGDQFPKTCIDLAAFCLANERSLIILAHEDLAEEIRSWLSERCKESATSYIYRRFPPLTIEESLRRIFTQQAVNADRSGRSLTQYESNRPFSGGRMPRP
jgi:hypothetical protein